MLGMRGRSVISSVTNKGVMRWKIVEGALNSDIAMDFLRRLIKDAGRKVCLFLDNLRVHHSKPVKSMLAPRPSPLATLRLDGPKDQRLKFASIESEAATPSNGRAQITNRHETTAHRRQRL